MGTKKYMKLRILLVLFFIISFKAHAQIEKFQVAYIYNFTKFVEWPASDVGNSFVIGVLDKNAKIIPELKTLASSKKIVNKPIEIKVFGSVAEISNCNMLFVPVDADVSAAVAKTSGKSILVISNKTDAIRSGSAINFIMAGSKLQFELRTANATSRGLKVNSSLKNLASKVY